MNESTFTQPADENASTAYAGQAAPSGVLLLRQARERAGLHPAALAAMLKVPLYRLEALEAGRFDELPDITFARALTLSLCRVLKLDPQPILATFPASGEVRLGHLEQSLNQTLPTRSMPFSVLSGASMQGLKSWPVLLALLLAVLAVLLWFFLPQRDETVQADQFGQLPVITEAVPMGTQATSESAPAASAQINADEAAARASAGDDAAGPVPLAQDAAPAAALPAAAATDGFTMNARQTAWVQVTGASGKVLLQRTLQSGEQVVFGDDFPLSVVVGRADAVDVSLRGQPLDMSPHARNNVARFEVR